MNKNLGWDFTVLMAVYGGDSAPLFRMALDSLFANSLRPGRMVLVVDGPVTVQLEQVIAEFEETESITVCRLPTNQGLSVALNRGLSRIETEWVVRADADDFNHSHRFQKMFEALERAGGELDILGSAIQEVNLDGDILSVRSPPETHREIMEFARKRNPFNHMTVAFRTAQAKKVGGYPNVHMKEDYALWVKLLSNGARAANLPDTLVQATTGEQMYKRRGGVRYAVAEVRLQRLLVGCGFKGTCAAVVHGLSRSVIFLAPTSLRARFYKKYLRSSA